ncbi:hypothetical protein Maq22A_1p31245 (plasmid) [Methylobacterium aquaticum]|uniref:Uncharacterized protein n=1 Tax=Methylobacterium aquaticum TaxID=270351 RepID=A0A0C6FSV4_9HYPH|nr:hypothetical protein Maq22A_1p31245 [Methylobacterium aquaticum]
MTIGPAPMMRMEERSVRLGIGRFRLVRRAASFLRPVLGARGVEAGAERPEAAGIALGALSIGVQIRGRA